MPPKASQTLSYTGTDMKKHSVTATPASGFKFSKCDYSNGTYTATFVEDEWLPMTATDGDGNLVNFYPAFYNASELEGYTFAILRGEEFHEIPESAHTMLGICNHIILSSDKKTLYYKKIDSGASPLKCYTVIPAL